MNALGYEVFALDGSINDDVHDDYGRPLAPGWYWCPGAGRHAVADINGPFETKSEAVADANFTTAEWLKTALESTRVMLDETRDEMKLR